MDSDSSSNKDCQDKMAFDSQSEAEAAALTAKWQHGTDLVTYQCQYCQLWHLSSV